MPTIEESVEVNVPVSTAYSQWTRFEEFPQFMDGIKEVRRLDAKRLHWVAEINGHTEEWDAEITEQRPDERVAWKATSVKENAGVVTFHRIDDQKSKIMVQLDWESEGMVEKLGEAMGQDDRKVKSDLERFKELVEK
jgi:uncharacterized membrane protein